MKLEIFGEEKHAEEPVRLRLKKKPCGTVTVIAVDAGGGWISDLVTFDTDGLVYMHSSVSKCLGFNLGSAGRISLKS